MTEIENKVLDPDVIASLRSLGGEDDPELFVELVQLFLEDTPSRIRELDSALTDNDAAALERSAHALKSSAANLGAEELSLLFRALEQAGRDHDLQRASGLLRESNAAYERVEQALRAEIG